VALLALFLATRLLVLFCSPHIVDYEESYIAAAAVELAAPDRLPLQSYQYTHYEGGTLLNILLTAPLVAIFGSGFLVVKIPALLMALLLAWLGFCYLDCAVGRDAALYGLAAWTFAPPYLLQLNLLNWGCYQEVALIGLGWLILIERARRRTGPDGPGWWLTIGALAGFGIWVHYSFALALAAGAPSLLDRLRTAGRLRLWIATLTGLAVGLAPWLAYNLSHDWVGLQRLADGAPHESLGQAIGLSVGRFWAMLVEFMPPAYHLPGFGHEGLALALGWSCQLILLGLTATLLTNRTRPRPLLLWYLAAFALAFSVSRYTGAEKLGPHWGGMSTQSHVHMLPLLPMLLLTAAAGLQTLRARRPRLCAALGGTWAVLGVVGLVGLLLPTNVPRVQYQDASVPQMLDWSSGLKSGQLGRPPDRPSNRPVAGAPFHALGYGAGAWSRVLRGLAPESRFQEHRRGFRSALQPYVDMGRGIASGISRMGDPSVIELARQLPWQERAPFLCGCAMAIVISEQRPLGDALADVGIQPWRIPPGMLRLMHVATVLVSNSRELDRARRLWPMPGGWSPQTRDWITDLRLAFAADAPSLIGQLDDALRQVPNFPQEALLDALAHEKNAPLFPSCWARVERSTPSTR